MRCKACNIVLTDAELKKKDRDTGDFLDLCTECAYVSEETLAENQLLDEIVLDNKK